MRWMSLIIGGFQTVVGLYWLFLVWQFRKSWMEIEAAQRRSLHAYDDALRVFSEQAASLLMIAEKEISILHRANAQSTQPPATIN